MTEPTTNEGGAVPPCAPRMRAAGGHVGEGVRHLVHRKRPVDCRADTARRHADQHVAQVFDRAEGMAEPRGRRLPGRPVREESRDHAVGGGEAVLQSVSPILGRV